MARRDWMVRRWHEEIGWCADGTKRSDGAQMARRDWMVRRWHEEIGWCADGTKRSDGAQMVFLKTRASGRARQIVYEIFFFVIFKKRIFVRKCFYDPFYFFLPPKKRERSSAF